MTLKLAQLCDDPQKISTKSSYPKNIFFLKTPKNIEIQNFEPLKIARAYACVKISEYPLPGHVPASLHVLPWKFFPNSFEINWLVPLFNTQTGNISNLPSSPILFLYHVPLTI